jgi:hypothetical protein
VYRVPEERCQEVLKKWESSVTMEEQFSGECVGVILSEYGDIVLSVPIWLAIEIAVNVFEESVAKEIVRGLGCEVYSYSTFPGVYTFVGPKGLLTSSFKPSVFQRLFDAVVLQKRVCLKGMDSKKRGSPPIPLILITGRDTSYSRGRPLFLWCQFYTEIYVHHGAAEFEEELNLDRIGRHPHPPMKYSNDKAKLEISEGVEVEVLEYVPNPDELEFGHPIDSVYDWRGRFICPLNPLNKPVCYPEEMLGFKTSYCSKGEYFGYLRGFNEYFEVRYWLIREEYAPFGWELRRYLEGGEIRRVKKADDVEKRVGFNDECLVCKEEVDEYDWVMSCGHVVHRWCAKYPLEEEKCPYCQQAVKRETKLD